MAESGSRTRFPVLLATVWGGLILIGVGGVVGRHAIEAQGLQRQTRDFAELLAAPVWDLDDQGTARALDVIVGGNLFVDARVVLPDGTVFAEEGRPELLERGWFLGHAAPQIRQTIRSHGRDIGTFVVQPIDRRGVLDAALGVLLLLVGGFGHLSIVNARHRRTLTSLRLERETLRAKELEAALKARDEELRVDRLQREFLSIVSHELRTPLTSVHGAVRLLRGGVAGELPERAHELLELADKNAVRLTRLIDDILDLEKVASGQLDVHPEPVDVVAVTRRAVETMATYHRDASITYEVVAPDAPVIVSADPGRLQQVLANLLSNAAKFSPAGGVVTVVIAGDGPSVRVDVIDHGPGVPDAMRERIFERFVQADASDGRQRGGTGLGLPISRALVVRHGGTLTLDPAADATRFVVTLPVTGPAGR